MKRILMSLIAIITVFMLLPVVRAEEKVPVYMLSKDGCSACLAASEFFANLAKENPDLFELIELQVFDSNWNFASTDLQNMFIAIYEKFDEDTSKAATPTIVIGDYHTVGLPQDTDIIKNKIIEVKNSKEKVDVVKDIAKTLNIDIEAIRKGTTNKEEEKSGKYDTIIIIGIFVVLIGGFAGLVIASKK